MRYGKKWRENGLCDSLFLEEGGGGGGKGEGEGKGEGKGGGGVSMLTLCRRPGIRCVPRVDVPSPMSAVEEAAAAAPAAGCCGALLVARAVLGALVGAAPGARIGAPADLIAPGPRSLTAPYS